MLSKFNKFVKFTKVELSDLTSLFESSHILSLNLVLFFKSSIFKILLKVFLIGTFIPHLLLNLSAKSILSQSILFEYQVIEDNIFYINGERKNEFDNSTVSNGFSTYGQNYVIRSRTGYQHDYFAVLLDYTYSLNEINFFNKIGSKIDPNTANRSIHSIEPYLFGIYDPLRIGISYFYRNNDQPLAGEQVWSLKPNHNLSFYFQVYFSELWEDSPIGLSARYHIAFDPTLSQEAIKSRLFHQFAFGFHINFNYYGQFEILFSHLIRNGEFYIYRIANDGRNNVYYRDQIKRYYLDYIYTFQILKEFSIMFGVGQMVYSEYESPMLRFLFGTTYTFVH